MENNMSTTKAEQYNVITEHLFVESDDWHLNEYTEIDSSEGVLNGESQE